MIRPDDQIMDAPFAIVCTDFGIVICQKESDFRNFCKRAATDPMAAIECDKHESFTDANSSGDGST